MRPKNEKPLCRLVRHLISRKLQTEFAVEEVERQERSRKAVEEVWRSPAANIAVEHTLLESFPGQVEDDAAFSRLIAPLESVLDGTLPGNWRLAVPVGSARRFKGKPLRLQKALVLEILRAAQDTHTKAELPGVGLKGPVVLSRSEGPGDRFLVRRSLVGDDAELERHRLERTLTALQAKCPKLGSEARRIEGYGLLLLETNDIALSNFVKSTEAIRTALSSADPRPDIVLLAETDAGSPFLWLVENRSPLELSELFDGSRLDWVEDDGKAQE